MNFNPDANQQAKEIVFNRKKSASLHPVVHFDNRPVNQLINANAQTPWDYT